MMVGGLYAACCHMTLVFAIMHLYVFKYVLCLSIPLYFSLI